MAKTKPRTLIIGLDGATFDLINPLMLAGQIPNIARLIAGGAHGPLQTWPNTNSAAAWTSMVTGYNAGRHGIFHFSKALSRSDAGTGWKPATAADRKEEPFWKLMSAAGQRAGIINVPITYPADCVNGFMISGMDTPGLDSPGFTHPKELLDELRAQAIDYVIDVPNLGDASRRDPCALPASVARMIEARARATLHLMQFTDWDALMTVFVATDRVQHYFWPEDLSNVQSADWTPIRSVYRQIDEFIGEALALIDDDTTVLLVSDHGFGRLPPAKRSLNRLFARLGLLKFRERGGSARSRLLKNMLVTGRKLLPYELQDKLARRMPGLHLRAVNELGYSEIEWAETQVYSNPQGGRVWINLEGRSSRGAVPEKDYDKLREQVIEILCSLTDPVTGRPVVRAARRREELFHGPFVDMASDIAVEWDYDALNDSLCYAAGDNTIIIEPEKGKGKGNRWKGNHRPEGIFIACGPHVRQGAAATDAVIYDIAATVLYLQGLPVPEDMDGKVLTGIFTEEKLRASPVTRSKPSSINAQTDAERLSEEEERLIEERLRGLGYIE